MNESSKSEMIRQRKKRSQHDTAAIEAIEQTKRNTKPIVSNVAVSSSGFAEHLGAIILLGVVLITYIQTLYPTIAGGDSGELVAESCHLGISHPPGYPLFNMLVHVFVYYGAAVVSDKTIAWKANLFNALCDSMAVVLVYKTILLWTHKRHSNQSVRIVAAFSAAALLAFSPLIWTYAVGAEVFAFNNLFASSLVYLVLQYSIDRSQRLAVVGAMVSGLAMCNQHTIILFEIPIILWVLWTRFCASSTFVRDAGVCGLAFIAGLLPYMYMPLMAMWRPQPGSWGDISTFRGFLHHLRRADYGTFQLFSGSGNQQSEGLSKRLELYARDLIGREFPFGSILLVFVGFGIVTTWSSAFCPQAEQPPPDPKKKNKKNNLSNHIGKLLVAMYLFYMVVFHSLANLPLSEGLLYGVHMRFWQQPNIVIFIWLGIGISSLLHRINYRLLVPICGLGCVGLVGLQWHTWFEHCDQSQAWFISNYASALVDPLPPNALLFVNFDLQWTSLRYLQRCEHKRLDVTVINLSMMTYQWFQTKHTHYPNLQFPGTRLVPFGSIDRQAFSLAMFLDANLQQRKKKTKKISGIFLGGKLNYNDQDFITKYTLVPFGLLDQFVALDQVDQIRLNDWFTPQATSVMPLIQERLPALPPSTAKYNDETWEWTIARDYQMKQLSFATFLLERTIADDPFNRTLLVQAANAMEQSYQFEPTAFWNAAATLKNLGLAYAQLVKSPPQQEHAQVLISYLNDRVGQTVADKTQWRERASARMLEVWFAWLQLPEAREDPGFTAIESIVSKFMPVEPAEPEDDDSDDRPSKPVKATGKKTTKKTKKKKKKKPMAAFRQGKMAVF